MNGREDANRPSRRPQPIGVQYGPTPLFGITPFVVSYRRRDADTVIILPNTSRLRMAYVR